MLCTPDLGKMTTVLFAVLFIVSWFDGYFKRFICYIKTMLWSDPHSPHIDKIETYYIRMSRKFSNRVSKSRIKLLTIVT